MYFYMLIFSEWISSRNTSSRKKVFWHDLILELIIIQSKQNCLEADIDCLAWASPNNIVEQLKSEWMLCNQNTISIIFWKPYAIENGQSYPQVIVKILSFRIVSWSVALSQSSFISHSVQITILTNETVI